jgi:hypothetical protein
MSNVAAYRSDALQSATELYRAGRLDDAEAVCRVIVGASADDLRRMPIAAKRCGTSSVTRMRSRASTRR